MARKSRKPGREIKNTVENKSYTWHAALYIRLSVEDARYKKTSESLSAQQYMLEQYAADLPDMTVQGIYSDNGETGVSFKRPAFSQMITDIHSGKINCILVKDLSRFGRNYIESGIYLEEVFPSLGVRFISVTDMFDTSAVNRSDHELGLALKNIIHESYARDISAKIRSSLKIKQQKGDFIGSFPVYGYIKDPDMSNHLIINPQTANNVVDIFNSKLAGLSNREISQKLNESGIPSPGKFLYETGVLQRNDLKTAKWTPNVISRILKCRTYIGHMTQRKSKNPVFGEKKSVLLPEEEWIVVEDTQLSYT